MRLYQTEQVGRMHGMVRHSDAIGMGEIVYFGARKRAQQVGGHTSDYRIQDATVMKESMKRFADAAALCLCLLVASCQKHAAMENSTRDIHSYSNPDQIRVRHVDLDCDVLFDRKIIKGAATLTLERVSTAPALILDTRKLTIHKVEVADTESKFVLAAADPILGAPL